MGNAKVNQIKKVDHVDDRNQNIEINTVLSDLPPDHDPYVGNNGGCEKKQEMYIKYGIKRFFRFCHFLFPEQQQVGKGQKRSKVKEVTQFKQYGGFHTSAVIPERLQDQDGDNKQNDIPDKEKGLKNTMEKITHIVVLMIYTKLRKEIDIC
jgi:hypothetical protein